MNVKECEENVNKDFEPFSWFPASVAWLSWNAIKGEFNSYLLVGILLHTQGIFLHTGKLF